MLTSTMITDALASVGPEWLVVGPIVAGVVVDKVRQLWTNSPAYRRFSQKQTASTIDLRNVAMRAEPVGTPTIATGVNEARSAIQSPPTTKKPKKEKPA